MLRLVRIASITCIKNKLRGAYSPSTRKRGLHQPYTFLTTCEPGTTTNLRAAEMVEAVGLDYLAMSVRRHANDPWRCPGPPMDLSDDRRPDAYQFKSIPNLTTE